MDNLCHTLTGVALAQAGLARRTRYGTATLVVAANLPDVDVGVFVTDTLAVSFRRGWTHGVLAQAVLPVVLAGMIWGWGRWRDGRRAARPEGGAPVPTRLPALLLLSYVGLSSHIFLDYLNSYGIRLLMPFSNTWFYGDALYIFDPIMWVVLGWGVWLSRRRTRTGRPGPWQPARVALVVAAVYAVAMLGSNWWARAVVRGGLTRAGRSAETRFMVTPVFANPLRREVLVDTGTRYEKGQVWFAPTPHFRPLGYGVNTGFDQPEARAALATSRAEAFRRWARFPFVVVDRTARPARIFLNDYRYSDAGGRAGWAGLRVEIDERHGEGHEAREDPFIRR